MLIAAVFTGALLTSCAVIFLSLESRKEVILALLRGERDPRFGAPFGTGFRPTDRAAARLAGSRFNPSRGVSDDA